MATAVHDINNEKEEHAAASVQTYNREYNSYSD
jgi:hypothetical protein